MSISFSTPLIEFAAVFDHQNDGCTLKPGPHGTLLLYGTMLLTIHISELEAISHLAQTSPTLRSWPSVGRDGSSE